MASPGGGGRSGGSSSVGRRDTGTGPEAPF